MITYLQREGHVVGFRGVCHIVLVVRMRFLSNFQFGGLFKVLNMKRFQCHCFTVVVVAIVVVITIIVVFLDSYDWPYETNRVVSFIELLGMYVLHHNATNNVLFGHDKFELLLMLDLELLFFGLSLVLLARWGHGDSDNDNDDDNYYYYYDWRTG
jgi:hypothetical protein